MVCMMKIFPNMQTLVFLVVVHIPVSCLATGVLRSSFWSALTSRRMTSHQAAVSSRSAAECIRECKKYSFCNRVAFQRWNATCYLLPSTRIGQTAADVDVIIYADKGKSSLCPHILTSLVEAVCILTVRSSLLLFLYNYVLTVVVML